ncbi:hypothetical protein JTE90_001300 [Oedothorax gibbosus]|uniref:E3 ubiquitin-protein ligase RNF180 n=1 Tax=Oedothorax gibbosus TaxID=931172 RepID=A0AAV6TSJ0_9ARAC|nr:hypothetical protein JTE90_001300 [Oedothorax gibbosus]
MQVDDSRVMFKCRKCRKTLFSEREACDPHSEPIAVDENQVPPCAPIAQVYFLREDTLPDWAREQVDAGDWQKGKLFCPHCQCRIGSFDFVGGAKCQCGEKVLPSLHVSSNKLDRQLRKPHEGEEGVFQACVVKSEELYNRLPVLEHIFQPYKFFGSI